MSSTLQAHSGRVGEAKTSTPLDPRCPLGPSRQLARFPVSDAYQGLRHPGDPDLQHSFLALDDARKVVVNFLRSKAAWIDDPVDLSPLDNVKRQW